MKEVAIGLLGRRILQNDDLEVAFYDINCMVPADTLPNYPDWKIPFTVHTYTSDKQLVAFISQNNESIDLFYIK